MPIKAPPPAAPAPVPTYNWSGFYIGGNAGGAWGNFDPISAMPLLPGGVIAPDVSIFNALGASQGIKPNGFTGGAEAGYNFQWHNIVFGLEGDCKLLRLSGNSTVAGFFAPAAPVNLSASAHASWLATARGRIGITADNWLFYGTGGVALTALRGGFTFTDPTAGDTEPCVALHHEGRLCCRRRPRGGVLESMERQSGVSFRRFWPRFDGRPLRRSTTNR